MLIGAPLGLVAQRPRVTFRRWVNDFAFLFESRSSADLYQSLHDKKLQNGLMTYRSIMVLVSLLVSSCAPGLPDASNESGLQGDRLLLEDATSEQIEAGRLIVELQCVSCHAVRSGDLSKNLVAPPLRTLAERYPVTGLPEAFAQGVLVGHPNMPNFRFSPQQIAEILAYVQSIQTRQGA